MRLTSSTRLLIGRTVHIKSTVLTSGLQPSDTCFGSVTYSIEFCAVLKTFYLLSDFALSPRNLLEKQKDRSGLIKCTNLFVRRKTLQQGTPATACWTDGTLQDVLGTQGSLVTMYTGRCPTQVLTGTSIKSTNLSTGITKKKERKKHKLSSAAKTAAARWFLISSSAQVVLKYKSSFAKSIWPRRLISIPKNNL